MGKKPPKKTFEGFLIFVSFELEIKVKFWLSGDYMHVTCYLNHTDFSHKYLLAYSFIPVGYFFQKQSEMYFNFFFLIIDPFQLSNMFYIKLKEDVSSLNSK